MSGGTEQPTQSTTTTISPQAQQLFNLAYPNIAQFAANTPERYQGSTVAPFNPTQQTAQTAALTAAGTQADIAGQAVDRNTALPGQLDWTLGTSATPFVGTPLQTSSNVFSDPGVWNPDYNPGMTAAIDAANRPVYQNLYEKTLPSIRDTSVATGFGGSRADNATLQATRDANTIASDNAAKIVESLYGTNLGAVNNRYATNLGAENQRYGTDVAAGTAYRGQDIAGLGQRYGTNVNALLTSLGLTPMLQEAVQTPVNTIGAVGDTQYAMQQAQLTDQINKWNYDQLAPYLASKDIMSLIQGLPGQTTTSTANVPAPSPFTSVLGGAATGAAIGSAIPGVGTAVGGLAGGVAGTLPFLFR